MKSPYADCNIVLKSDLDTANAGQVYNQYRAARVLVVLCLIRHACRKNS